MRLGTTTINSLLLGTTAINAAYLGAVQVFGGVPPASWDPSDLDFSATQGAWYDPSDTATMWQNTDGQGNADGAVNSPVGFMFDKSKLTGTVADYLAGLSYTRRTGWTNVGSAAESFTTSGDGFVGERTTVGGWTYYNTSASHPVTIHTWYRFRFRVGPTNTAAFQVGINSGTNGRSKAVLLNSPTINTTYEVFVLANTATATLSLSFQQSSLGITDIEWCEATAGLSGNHAFATSDAARPILRESGAIRWLEFDGVDDRLTSNNITGQGNNFEGLVALEVAGLTGGSTNVSVFGAFLAATNRADLALRAQSGGIGRASLTVRAAAGTQNILDDGNEYSHADLNPHVTRYGHNGVDTMFLQVDAGTLHTVARTITTTFTGSYIIGGAAALFGHNFFGGFEIKRQLTAGERTDARTYLNTKAGI